MKFLDLAEKYIEAKLICPQYQARLRAVAEDCGEVSAEAINEYLRWRQPQVSSVTLRNERTNLLTLWRYGYEVGLLDLSPRGVAKVRVRRPPTKAWTPDQLRTLLRAADSFHRRTMSSGANGRWFLRAWILLGYETGARKGDLWAFRDTHLDAYSISWTQSKTGDPLTRVLTDQCREAIDEMLLRGDGRIIGWASTMRQSSRMMANCIRRAGLQGTSKWLRRSGATHCEMRQAGAGRLHLGHRSPALFEQAYCDWAQLRSVTPSVPPLLED